MLNHSELYAYNIKQDSQLITLIENILEKSTDEFTFPRLKKPINNLTPPIFIYEETRGSQNKLGTMQYTFGGGSDTQIIGFGDRNILELNKIDNLGRREVGEILIAFSYIDFILDIFIFHDFNVYSRQTNFKDVSKKMYKIGKPFHSTENKIDYLCLKGRISKDTSGAIKKFKKIRNALAHQYLPVDNWGVHIDDINLGKNLQDTIEIIVNNAWLLMLIDYNKIQYEVLGYFIDV